MCPDWGAEPATRICALTGNRTWELCFMGGCSQPTEPHQLQSLSWKIRLLCFEWKASRAETVLDSQREAQAFSGPLLITLCRGWRHDPQALMGGLFPRSWSSPLFPLVSLGSEEGEAGREILPFPLLFGTINSSGKKRL